MSPITGNKESSSETKKDTVTTITTTALVEDIPKDKLRTDRIVVKRKAPPPPTIKKQAADRDMNNHFNDISKADDTVTRRPVPTRRAPPPPTVDSTEGWRPVPTRRAPLPPSTSANNTEAISSVEDGGGDATINDQGAKGLYATSRPIKGRKFVSGLNSTISFQGKL